MSVCDKLIGTAKTREEYPGDHPLTYYVREHCRNERQEGKDTDLSMRVRKLAAFLLAGVLALPLSGCGSKDPAYLSGIDPNDYVEVGTYTDIPVSEAQPEVTDEYVESYIQYVLSSNQTTEEVTDRTDVESGDVVNIDYTGRKDGVEFDGGSATGYDLTIGSNSFIDGFEDGLIGHKVGETVDLNLTFPEDYSNKDLAGQAVVFTVKINKISKRVTPELDDAFVASQNIAGVTTVEQYRNYVKNQLMQNAQQTYDQDVQSQIVDYLLDNSTFTKDPPTEMVSRYFDRYQEVLTQYAQQYGLDLDTYASLAGVASTEESSTDSTEASEAAADASTETDEASRDESSTADSGDIAAEGAGTEESGADSTEASEVSTEASTASDTADSMNESTRKGITDLATRQAKELIILGAIADKEGMSIREREYESAVSTQAPSMGYTGLDDFEEGEDEEAFKEQLLEQKVLEFLQSKAKISEPEDSSASADSTEASSEDTTEASEDTAAEASTEE